MTRFAETWTPELDAQLTALWPQALSGSAIGRALGKTKGAVLGRADRLGLLRRRPPASVTSWTRDRDAQLESLWNQGLSASAIGAAMDASSGSVLGRAHRLGLPRRKSPIYAGPYRCVSPKPQAVQMPATFRTDGGRESSVVYRRGAVPGITLAGVTHIAAAPIGPARACQWPFGHPGEPGFRFCGAPSTHRSYCAAHAAVAYVPLGQRAEAA